MSKKKKKSISFYSLFLDYLSSREKVNRDVVKVENQDIFISKERSIILRMRDDLDWTLYFLLDGSFMNFPKQYIEIFRGFWFYLKYGDVKGEELKDPDTIQDVSLYVLTGLLGCPELITEAEVSIHIDHIKTRGLDRIRDEMIDYGIEIDPITYATINGIEEL